jgi:hypothetical protein
MRELSDCHPNTRVQPLKEEVITWTEDDVLVCHRALDDLFATYEAAKDCCSPLKVPKSTINNAR